MAGKRQRKTPPEKRLKVSTACDACKKKKYRCSGTAPCELCTKRGFVCTFTAIDKRSLKGERVAQEKRAKQLQTPESVVKSVDPTADSNMGVCRVSLPSISVIFSSKADFSPSFDLSGGCTKREVPRITMDSKGSIYYWGESSMCSLASELHYLQQYLGGEEIKLMPEDQLFRRYELDNDILTSKPLPLPSRSEMLDKAANYLIDWTGFLLLSPEELEELVVDVYDRNSKDPIDRALMYLLVAFSDFEDKSLVVYFRQAVQLLKQHFTYVAEKRIAQAHFLICQYFKACSHFRESYFHMALCINFCNQLKFSVSDNAMERRFYGSLIFCDAVCSAILGSTPNIQTSNLCVKGSNDVIKLGYIVNRILVNMYNNTNELDLSRVKELTITLKTWALELTEDNFIVNARKWESCIMHFSDMLAIMLISRPLFISHILRHCNPQLDRKPLSNITSHYFEACIQAAIYSIQMRLLWGHHKEAGEEPAVITTMTQAALVIYVACLFLDKFGQGHIKHKFSRDYLLFSLSESIPFVNVLLQDTLKKFLATEDITGFSTVDLNHVQYFQGNFVNQDVAPAIPHPSRTYDSYDTLILSKV